MRIVLYQNEASFKHLFEDFLISCKAKGLADKTISSYKSHMLCVAKYIDIDKKIDKIQQEDINDMIVAMRDKGLSPNTIKSYLRVIAAFLTWCREHGYTSLKISYEHSKKHRAVWMQLCVL